MPEMPHGGENHRDAMFISSLDNLFIADAAAGLNDGGYTGFGCGINAVTEREEGIGREYRSTGRKQCFLDSYF